MRKLFSIGIWLTLISAPAGSAQTLNWGSEVFSDLVDSNGNKLEDTFIFEVGAFEGGFVPQEGNVHQWFDYWRVFDRADYNYGQDPSNPVYDYFTGTANMDDFGFSSSPDASAFSFAGLEAFIWVRNSNDAALGTEWFLARATGWEFPAAFPGCCDNALPIEWSISDLSLEGSTLVWGRQGDQKGGGLFVDDNPHDLQTYTFIPEPSSMFLIAISGLMVAARRRR